MTSLQAGDEIERSQKSRGMTGQSNSAAASSRNQRQSGGTAGIHGIDSLGNSLIVKAELSGMVTDCLIDTGASVSIAPTRFAEGAEIRPCRISEKLTAVNGEQLPVLGEANLVIRLGFWVVKRRFVIVPMQVNPILGADFLADHSIIINMSEQRMSWIGGSVPLMMPEEHHEPGHLVLSETVETDGMSVMVVSAKVISEGKGPRISCVYGGA